MTAQETKKEEQLVILSNERAVQNVKWVSSRIRDVVCDKMQYFRRRRKWSGRASGGGGFDLLATLSIFFSTVPLIVRSGKKSYCWFILFKVREVRDHIK